MQEIQKIFSVVILTAAMGLAASAQLLIKYAINSEMTVEVIQGSGGLANMIKLVFNSYFLSGVALYTAATVLWVYSLTRVQLSYATPFLALTYVLISAGAWIFFQETFTTQKIIGTGLVIIGLVLINFP